jgi:hypothetical protein
MEVSGPRRGRFTPGETNSVPMDRSLGGLPSQYGRRGEDVSVAPFRNRIPIPLPSRSVVSITTGKTKGKGIPVTGREGP